jgi:hypothetical protein
MENTYGNNWHEDIPLLIANEGRLNMQEAK